MHFSTETEISLDILMLFCILNTHWMFHGVAWICISFFISMFVHHLKSITHFNNNPREFRCVVILTENMWSLCTWFNSNKRTFYNSSDIYNSEINNMKKKSIHIVNRKLRHFYYSSIPFSMYADLICSILAVCACFDSLKNICYMLTLWVTKKTPTHVHMLLICKKKWSVQQNNK